MLRSFHSGKTQHPRALDPGELQDPSGQPARPVFSELVRNLLKHNPQGVADLQQVFFRGVRLLLSRQLAPDEADDATQAALCSAVEEIRRCGCDPDRLPQLVRSHVYKRVKVPEAKRSPRPDSRQVDIMRRILSGVPVLHRQALARYYLERVAERDVCDALGLTKVEFRQIKAEIKGTLFGRRTSRCHGRAPATVASQGFRPKHPSGDV